MKKPNRRPFLSPKKKKNSPTRHEPTTMWQWRGQGWRTERWVWTKEIDTLFIPSLFKFRSVKSQKTTYWLVELLNAQLQLERPYLTYPHSPVPSMASSHFLCSHHVFLPSYNSFKKCQSHLSLFKPNGSSSFHSNSQFKRIRAMASDSNTPTRRQVEVFSFITIVIMLSFKFFFFFN